MIAFLLILGGCVVALVWWAVRATQRQNTDRQLDSAERRAHDLFARLEAGIELTEMAGAVRELEDLKREYAALGAMSGTDAAGVLRQLEGLKQKIIREQERHGAQPTDQRSATDRQLDYIESLLDSTGTTLSAATRALLGRSVSIDRLSLHEASDLIDYLKEISGESQSRTTTRRRAAPRERKPGISELRPLLNRPDVLVVDVETTGFGDRAEVLAVAVVDTTGRVRLDTVSMPQGRIPTDASNVHGLTRARLRSMGARPWPEVHRKLENLLRDASVIVAWNVEFDRRLLHQTAKRHDLTLPVRPWHCAMEAETTTRGPAAPYAKLADAARRLGVSASGAHSALGDARATLAVVRALVSDVPA